jgi:hypothetical protein
VKGEVPSPINPPPGCVFHPRCPIAVESCSRMRPELREVRPGLGWPAARCANLRRAAAFRRWIPACFAGKRGRGWRYRSTSTTRGRRE